MSPSQSGILPVLAVASLGLLACAGGGDDPATGSTGGSGGTAGPSGALLPTRIRRLTNAEYDASIKALLGTTQSLAATTFPPDSRQSNFTLNDAQRVDPVLAKQLDDAATALAGEARGNGTLSRLAPCADAAAGGEACARTFIQSFGAQAYRRPLTTEEVDALLATYRVGADGAGYDDGVELVVRAALQSAGFLYLTELGDSDFGPQQAPKVSLNKYELASSLSYLVAAGPPDDMMLSAAAAGSLATPEGREAQVRRLLQLPGARDRLVRVVREWLGIDGVSDTAKDTTVYPGFADVRDGIDTESVAFINEVMRTSSGSVADLLGADWSIVDSTLASAFYDVPFGGAGARTTLGGRRGILNQGAFLSVFAHASESAPVLRGVAVLRRVACFTIQSPTELNINVSPPVPDPSKTTRERYAAHAVSTCAVCHNAIDNVGFAFEGFDGMGASRTTEGGAAVNSGTTIALNTDFDGTYTDSNALAAKLASSPSVLACVARQMFRASAGRSDSTVRAAEDDFVTMWQATPAGSQDKIIETLVSYVKSPLFIQRRTN